MGTCKGPTLVNPPPQGSKGLRFPHMRSLPPPPTLPHPSPILRKVG